MEERKLKVGIVGFPYAGNGGTQSEHPDVGEWRLRTVLAARSDSRISDGIAHRNFADTPITMTRNAALEWARSKGVDVLVMVDSDQAPDMYMGDPSAKPFFESSFDYLYKHYDKGPVAIFAPYCGPPGHPTQGGHENVYVFHWSDMQTGRDRDEFKMDQYSRFEAAQMTGIREAAAGPTGLCMIDMRCLEYMTPPYFYYQYEGDGETCPLCHQAQPGKQAEKASTEDVTFFRDLSLAVSDNLGYNPVLCNWDAWAGHWKPWCVGKPNDLTAASVSAKLRRAYERGGGTRKKLIQMTPQGPRPAEDNPFAKEDDPSNLGHITCDRDLATLKQLAQDEAAKHADRRDLICVELGSWTGKSAIAIAEGVEKHLGNGYTLYCVDTFNAMGGVSEKMKWLGSAPGDPIHETFKKNIGNRYARMVLTIRKTTKDAASWWREHLLDREIDFLFIDAGHTYEDVKADIEAWLPLVRPGGLICGHDYGSFPGVEQAVNEAFFHQIVNVTGTIWSTRKLLPIPDDCPAFHLEGVTAQVARHLRERGAALHGSTLARTDTGTCARAVNGLSGMQDAAVMNCNGQDL